MSRTIFVFLLIAVLCGSAFSDQEELKLEVIKIEHRNAGDMNPAALHHKSPEGKVTVDTGSNSLIITDYLSNIANMTETIRTLDVPVKQVGIRVVMAEADSVFLKEIGMKTGHVIYPPRKFKPVLELLDTGRNAKMLSEMQIRTPSNKPAELRVAQEEIFVPTVMMFPGGRAVLSGEREAGAFLEVLPVVNDDDTITIILRPSVSGFRGSNVKYERSALIQVIMGSGDTLAIGAVDTVKKITTKQKTSMLGVPLSEGELEEERKMVMFLTAAVID